MKHLRFLLGPLKDISENEMKIYEQAALFKHTIAAKTDNETASHTNKDDGEHLNSSGTSGYEGEEKGSGYQTVELKPLSNNFGTNGTLFNPLHCTTHSLKIQQTFTMWKAPLDMGWKFRRMRRQNTIALQPLDNFPEFVDRFRYKGREISFFIFLQDFMRIYFYGFNVDLLETIDMTKAKWDVKSR